MSVSSREKTSACKPSGYDVVIRNSLAIKKLNRAMDKASPKKRQAMIDEKERLMQEMWQACPHESIAHGTFRTRPGPGAEPIATTLRICTSCGFDEGQKNGRFKVLTRRKGRFISRPSEPGFRDTLNETLRRTGINL